MAQNSDVPPAFGVWCLLLPPNRFHEPCIWSLVLAAGAVRAHTSNVAGVTTNRAVPYLQSHQMRLATVRCPAINAGSKARCGGQNKQEQQADRKCAHREARNRCLLVVPWILASMHTSVQVVHVIYTLSGEVLPVHALAKAESSACCRQADQGIRASDVVTCEQHIPHPLMITCFACNGLYRPPHDVAMVK